jgi:hypothetical protein
VLLMGGNCPINSIKHNFQLCDVLLQSNTLETLTIN